MADDQGTNNMAEGDQGASIVAEDQKASNIAEDDPNTVVHGQSVLLWSQPPGHPGNPVQREDTSRCMAQCPECDEGRCRYHKYHLCPHTCDACGHEDETGGPYASQISVRNSECRRLRFGPFLIGCYFQDYF